MLRSLFVCFPLGGKDHGEDSGMVSPSNDSQPRSDVDYGVGSVAPSTSSALNIPETSDNSRTSTCGLC